MRPMSKIAILQMTSGIDPAANAATIVDAVERAAAGGAVALFTPEMSGLLDRERARGARHVVAAQDNPVLAAVRAAAARAGITVMLGSLAVTRDQGRWANRSFAIGPDGAILATYDKIHMFDVALESGETWRESAAYAPGEAVVTVAVPDPTTTSFLPVTDTEAVHLPRHLIAPRPYELPAELHLPVFTLLSAVMNLPVRAKSATLPLPKQSKT